MVAILADLIADGRIALHASRAGRCGKWKQNPAEARAALREAFGEIQLVEREATSFAALEDTLERLLVAAGGASVWVRLRGPQTSPSAQGPDA